MQMGVLSQCVHSIYKLSLCKTPIIVMEGISKALALVLVARGGSGEGCRGGRGVGVEGCRVVVTHGLNPCRG